MRFAEPGKLAANLGAAGFTEIQEDVLTLPARWPGSPEKMLAAMMELATPLRHAIEEFSSQQREEATREVLDNLQPKFDGTYTHSVAPVLILSATR